MPTLTMYEGEFLCSFFSKLLVIYLYRIITDQVSYLAFFSPSLSCVISVLLQSNFITLVLKLILYIISM